MPVLKKYYEEHKGDDRFEMIAFHDARGKTLAQVDEELTKRKTREKYWNGEDLPFPVFLDATGETIKKYGVRAFPTTILIDPDGRLVGKSSRTKLLEQALAGELPPIRPRRIHSPSAAELADKEWRELPASPTERVLFFRLGATHERVDTKLLFRSTTLNPGRIYLSADVRGSLDAVVDVHFPKVRASGSEASSVHHQEIKALAAAGKLREATEEGLTEAQKQEVARLVQGMQRAMRGRSEASVKRNALTNWFGRNGYTGSISSGGKTFVARPEDLPKSQKAKAAVTRKKKAFVDAVAAWFEKHGALTGAERKSLLRRFDRSLKPRPR